MAKSRTVSGAEYEAGFADHPDHRLKVAKAIGRFTVRAAGTLIVETDRAFMLREADYPPVLYFAPEAVDETALRPTDHTTWCPFKGRASYFSIGDDPTLANAVWMYDDPFEEVGAIKGCFAFYPNSVDVAAQEGEGGD